MAIIRNQLALRMRGRVGAYSYYTEGGRQIVRQAQNSTNYGDTARRTETQQQRRAKWGNLVNFYKASKDWMPQAYETKKANQSDYNKFMSLNTRIVSCYLQKGAIAVGGCVVEPYIISEGSIRTIDVLKSGNVWRSDIKIGSNHITSDTTVAEFSAAVIAANPHIKEGYQLSFISYQQDMVREDLPQIICAAYEVTLDITNTDKLRAYLPDFCSSDLDGYLATNNNISVGAFAWIWSYSLEGRTQVSTQTLINNNQVLIARYTSFVAYNASIQSYGLDRDRFLQSGSAPAMAAAQPNYISLVQIGSTSLEPGDAAQYWKDLGQIHQPMEIYFGNKIVGNVKSFALVASVMGQTLPITSGITKSDASISIDYASWHVDQFVLNDELLAVIVSTTEGDYRIDFESSTYE